MQLNINQGFRISIPTFGLIFLIFSFSQNSFGISCVGEDACPGEIENLSNTLVQVLPERKLCCPPYIPMER